MKKLIALTLLLSLLCACGTTSKYPTDNEYHPETDYPYAMSMFLNYQEFVETENGYYFYAPYSMFFMDKETEKAVPLCSQPNCLHYEETEREKYRLCHAYIHGIGAGLPVAWHNNNLYVVAENLEAVGAPNIQILEISPDGSSRKTLWSFDSTTEVQEMRLHRGIMYLAARTSLENGESIATILAYNLDTPNVEPEILLEYPLFNNTTVQNMTVHGQYLYFGRFCSEALEIEFCIYNINTKELKIISPREDNMYPHSVLFVGDSMRILFQKGSQSDGTYTQAMVSCDYEGNNQQDVTTDYGFYTADGQYIYRGGNMWLDNGSDHYLHIYDENYNEIDRLDLLELPGMEKISSASYHIASDRVLIEAIDSTSRRFYHWFDKSEIGSGNIQPKLIIDYKDEFTEKGKN